MKLVLSKFSDSLFAKFNIVQHSQVPNLQFQQEFEDSDENKICFESSAYSI